MSLKELKDKIMYMILYNLEHFKWFNSFRIKVLFNCFINIINVSYLLRTYKFQKITILLF